MTIAALQLVSILLAAPLTVGLVRKVKARFQNRRGASPFLPYWTLISLMRKEMTLPQHSSWVFRAVPFVVCGTTIALALLIPTLGYTALPGFADSVFVVAGILLLGSAFLVFGGMDTGSTFGNMGSSREMTIAALIEPAFLLALASLGAFSGAWNLGGIAGYVAAHSWMATAPFLSVTFVALFLTILAENARYPVDNPATHLELTMVHEAMVLEYSGPYLALLEYASALKLTVLSVFLASLVWPFGLLHGDVTLIGVGTALAVLFIKIFAAAFVVAFVESTIVKMRFYRMQEYASLAFLFALSGCALVVASRLMNLV